MNEDWEGITNLLIEPVMPRKIKKARKNLHTSMNLKRN